MTTQSALLGLLIAMACGLTFHLLRGGSLRRMLLYVGAACVAFFTGHTVGGWLGWDLLRVGPLNLFPALLATVLGLLDAHLLAGEDPGRPSRSPVRRPSEADESDE